MGHKVHPNAYRLGIYRPWEANWYADRRDYTELLHQDLAMRSAIMGRLRSAGITKIETERSSNNQLTVTIHTAKPGIVIGKGGASVDLLREDLEKRFNSRIRISIQEIRQPELDARLVADSIASQIERRISYRRAMKQSILRTMRSGAKGVRIALAGRLRGTEMARREWAREGRVPLHTLRADIDFGRATARTTYGVIGIKVWIYRDDFRITRRRADGTIVDAQGEPVVAQELPQDDRQRRGGRPGGMGGARPARRDESRGGPSRGPRRDAGPSAKGAAAAGQPAAGAGRPTAPDSGPVAPAEASEAGRNPAVEGDGNAPA